MHEDNETFGPGKLSWGILIVIVFSLFAIALALVLRSHVFVPNGKSLSTEDAQALWAFIGSGVAAAVTLVGLLFTRSHNERTLALQKEAETRLALDTVVKSLDLVAVSGTYAPKAKWSALEVLRGLSGGRLHCRLMVVLLGSLFLIVPLDPGHEVLQVGWGELPFEGPGGVVVAALEGGQPVLDLVEVGEVVRCDDLA